MRRKTHPTYQVILLLHAKNEVASLFLSLPPSLFLFSLSPRFKIIEGDRWKTAGKQIPP